MMILPWIAASLWGLGFVFSLGFGLLPAVEIERLVAVLCVLAGAVILGLDGGALAQRRITAPVFCGAVLGLWLLVMVSGVWSVSAGTSLLYGGIFSVMPASVLALLFARETSRDLFLRLVLYTAAAVIPALGLWALAQVFIFPEYLVNGQVRHPFANPNAFAGLLTLCALVAFGLYLQISKRWLRLLLLAGLVLMGAALAAIASQTATLTLAGGIIVVALLSVRHLGLKMFLPLLPVFFLVCAIGMMMAAQPGKTDIVTRLSTLVEGHAGTWDNRVDIWQAALALVARHPLLGTGYKTFFLTYPSVRLPTETYSGGFMVHSDPLQFWVELGLSGFVLFYVAGGLTVMRFFAWYRSGGRDPLTIALFAGCGAFIVHSHVDFLLYTMPTMLAFALALATLTIRTQKKAGENTAIPLSFAARLPAQAQAGLVLLPVVMILYFFIPLMVSDYLSSRASRMVLQDDVEGFAKTVNAANRIGMGMNARPYTMAVTVPLGILKARYPAIPPEEQRQLFRQTDHLIRAGLRQNTVNPAMYFYRAELARHVLPSVLPEGYPAAENSLKAALAISPLHLPSRQALAQILLTRGEQAEALDLLVAGLDWPYTSFDPQGYFAQTIALAMERGRPELASHAEERRGIHNRRLARFMRQKSAVETLKEGSLFLP